MEKFSLDKWLKDKSRKVVTRDGRPVKILCIDCGVRESQPILTEITCGGNTKVLEYYNIDGTTQDKNLNLFFADEEEELTELQKTLEEDCDCYVNLYNDGKTREELREWIKGWCPRIIDLAIKEGNKVINEKVQKEKQMTEFEARIYNLINFSDPDNYPSLEEVKEEAEILLQLARSELEKEIKDEEYFRLITEHYKQGKQDALKDLPKWKYINQIQSGNHYAHIANGIISPSGYFISYDDLETLPKEQP